MIICKVGAFYNLCDERPKFQCLVRSLMVENKVDARNFLILADKEQAAEKFFGNGKRRLPNFRYADLRENPIENIGNLNSVRKIRLKWSIFQRFKNFVYVGGSFHFFVPALGFLSEPSDFVDKAAALAEGAVATKWSYSSQLACIFLSRLISSLRNG